MNTISKTDPAYHRALVAFEAGDVDLAYRALLATKGSPSRGNSPAASRIPLLWFFARMTSYERRYEESAKLVEKIHRFELARPGTMRQEACLHSSYAGKHLHQHATLRPGAHASWKITRPRRN